jgi:hypothetical protein
MSEERIDDWLEGLREGYNAPPDTPRDEMWRVIEAGLGESGSTVVSMDDARRRLRPAWHRATAWAAAAAAVLVMGVGIGRMTAPVAAPAASVAPRGGGADVMRTAAVEHLGDTEALLTLVRADARGGRLDPVVRPWSRTLLAQTRLLLDSPKGVDPEIRELLEDLELALIQIVGVVDADDVSGARAGVELDLAMRGLDNRELLPRIQAVLPAVPGLAGT